jgi:dUTP pyrophosphatase
MLKVRIKKLDENAKLPTRGSSSAAGYDLYSLNSVVLGQGETALVHTGLAVEIPEGYFGAIYARSGLATKRGIRPANCVGVIDSDYRGEILVALHSDNIYENKMDTEIIEEGERIAQLVIQNYEQIDFEEVDDLSDTSRGGGGFGSTGNN